MFGTAPRSTTSSNAGAPRVVHVMRSPVGGLFRHVCDLAEMQAQMGYAVGIICDSTTGSTAADERLAALTSSCTLGIHRLPMSRNPGLGDLKTVKAISTLIDTMAPGIIHGHGAKGGAYARLLPRRADRQVLYTPHGGVLHFSWFTPAGALFLSLERILRARTDGIVFESAFSARAYARKIGKAPSMRVIPNGLSETDLAPLPSNDISYDAVFVGEMRTLKGIDVLIEAAARIRAVRPFRLALAGSGPDEARFRQKVKASGLEDTIHFLGHRPARDVFAMGRVVVTPSLAESFPYVVLEAIAALRPVIATDVGGIPEIFGPHRGALIEPQDCTALTKAIEGALNMTAVTRARAQALHDRAADLFSAQRMAETITAFYAECAEAMQRKHALASTPKLAAA
jgi:glycosyltransferase involved in cell wall biosynthesis